MKRWNAQIVGIFFLFTISILGTSSPAQSQHFQPPDSTASSCFFSKKTISFLTVSSLFTTTLIDSYLKWWKGNYHAFDFYHADQLGGWFSEPAILGIDKIGHFYGAYFLYKTKKNILLWGGFDESDATWIAFAFTSAVDLLIEIGDGFSNYAFDYRDLIVDAAGLGYAMLQEKIPFFQNFNFKWSYFPPDKFSLTFTQHYDGHIFWLTANVHRLLNLQPDNHWTTIFQPAVGFSIGDGGAHRELVIGLDFNLNVLFNRVDSNWEFVRKEIELFHVPAPGIKYAKPYHPEYKALLFH